MSGAAQPAALLAQAQAAFRAGDFAGAAQLADRLPGLVPALQVAGLAHLRLGRAELARERLEAAARAAPNDPNIANSLGNALDACGQADAAVAAFRRAAALAPTSPDPHLNLGRIALKAGDAAAAASAYRAAVRLAPNRPGAWQGLALALQAAGELEEAAAALDRSLALAPDARALHARARLEQTRGGDDLPFWTRARQAAPGDPDIAVGHAVARRRAGDEAAAIADLEAIVAQFPDHLAAHAALAKIRFEAGDGDAFTRSYDAALARSAAPAPLWAALFSTWLQAGRPEAVLARIDAARVALGPTASRYEAAAATDAGDLARAEAAIQSADLAADRDLQLVNLRRLLKAGRPDEASALAEPLAMGGGRPDVWPYLATAWRMTGDPRWAWLEGDPRFIVASDVSLSPAELEETAETLRRLHQSRAHPLDQSLRGGSQTEGDLFARAEPAIRRLKAALAEAVRGYIDQLPPPDPRHPLLGPSRERFRFSGAWSVRLQGEGFHVNHVHETGWISSAFYVALPPGLGEVTADQQGWLTFGEPPAELALDLPPFRTLAPKPGRLALFPSTLWHGTRPFAAGERLTVAFDVVPG